MKNIHTILSEVGITIPEDKKAEFDKAVSENYKTAAEFEKKVNRLTDDLNTEKKRADTAEEALKGFDGIDPANIKTQLEEANKKVKEAQEAAQKQLDERDFNDALRTELDAIKFSSAAARKSIEAEIRNAGLKQKNGKILGLSDLIGQLKKEDASAFVDEAQATAQKSAARFDDSSNPTVTGGRKTKEEIMAIPDRAQRRAEMAKNFHLFNNNKGE